MGGEGGQCREDVVYDDVPDSGAGVRLHFASFFFYCLDVSGSEPFARNSSHFTISIEPTLIRRWWFVFVVLRKKNPRGISGLLFYFDLYDKNNCHM